MLLQHYKKKLRKRVLPGQKRRKMKRSVNLKSKDVNSRPRVKMLVLK